jgi:colicin import membrane protein
MSTIPDRQASTHADATTPRTARRPRSREKASFRYGYRYVRKKLANGRIDFERVPLTLDDVLHPQFGDVHVLSDPHGDDCNYLRYVLKDRYVGDRSVVVFSDCGIFWDVPRQSEGPRGGGEGPRGRGPKRVAASRAEKAGTA